MKTTQTLSKSLTHKSMGAKPVFMGSLVLILILSGCASRVMASVNQSPLAAQSTAIVSTTPTISDTETLQTPEKTVSPTSTDQPLVQLTFPPPEPEPTSNLRPPEYEIPLALNPNDHFYFSSSLPIDYVDKPLPDYRYGYILPDTTTMHTGTDFKVPLHTPILAAADGKVVFAGYGLLNGAGNKDDPYGLAVVIRHNLSFQNRTILTVYAHMEKTTVQKGDWVKSGDQIGNVGLTGATSGPHLHIEIRLEVDANEYEVQNPEMWIVPSMGYGVLAGRVMTTGGGLLGERQIWVKSLTTGETWIMYTYSTRMKHIDPYYQENLLLSDLAAGKYEVSFYYFGLQKQIVDIRPGAITFFQFLGKNGFKIGDPAPASTDEFLTHF